MDQKPKYTLKQFMKNFPDDKTCFDIAWKKRFGHMTSCPKCEEATKFYQVLNKKVYACGDCGYQISPLAGTIFHKSSTSLKDWFFAIYLFSISKNGVSAKELQRQLEVTYKTAWRMAKQIRKLFDEFDGDPLKGIILI